MPRHLPDDIEVRCEAPGLSLASLPVGVLASILTGLEDATAATAGEPLSFALVDVAEGSGRFFVRPTASALTALGLVGLAVASHVYESIPAKANSGLRQAIVAARDNGISVSVRLRAADLHPTFTFDGSTPLPPERAQSYCGETTIYARVIRVGGERPAVTLKPHNGKAVAAAVDVANARDLAGRLYQEIRCIGEAEWDAETNDMVRFTIKSWAPFEPSSVEQFTNDLGTLLHQAFGERPDVEALLADIRG